MSKEVPTSKLETFRAAPRFEAPEIRGQASVDGDHYIMLERHMVSLERDIEFGMHVESARALRDWLTAVLPVETPALPKLGMDTPWPLHDVLAKLIDASDHLLRDHGCDTHGWEEYRTATVHARWYLSQIRPVETNGNQAALVSSGADVVAPTPRGSLPNSLGASPNVPWWCNSCQKEWMSAGGGECPVCHAPLVRNISAVNGNGDQQ